MSDDPNLAASGGASATAPSAEEEMKQKRRERLRAWQENKGKDKDAPSTAAGKQQQNLPDEDAPNAIKPPTNDASDPTAIADAHPMETDAGDKEGINAAEVTVAEEEDHASSRRGWTLDDDEEEEEEEDANGSSNGIDATSSAEEFALSSPPKLSNASAAAAVDSSLSGSKRKFADETSALAAAKEAVFNKLTASTANNSHSTPAHIHSTVKTAADLASELSKKNLSVAAAATAAAAAAGNSEVLQQRRKSRLRASKWDTGDTEGTDANSAEAVGSSASSAAPMQLSAAAVTATASSGSSSSSAGDDNIDPLEAFMSSLYEGGAVVEQKEIAASENVIDPKAAKLQREKIQSELSKQVITLDEIMASFKQPTATTTSGVDVDNDVSASSSSRVRVLRGWESDAGGESPDGNSSNANTPQGARSAAAADSAATPMSVAFAGTDEEDNGFRVNHFSENKYGDLDEDSLLHPNETTAEREARLDREKQEFVQAIRKAREEEDRMRERLMQIDQRQLQQSASSSSSFAPGKKSYATNADTFDDTTEGAAAAAASAVEAPALGRIFAGDGDMVEEYEITKNRKKSSLEILEDAKRGKQLKEVDHSRIDYLPFRKNLYIVPRVLSRLDEEQVQERREDLHIKVRGKGCPAPVDTWEQCGLSDRILQSVQALGLKEPFPIQKQAIPAVMCGRDVIGVAKTGSGKTLAFVLPMLRHILDQPPLLDGEGPIGLILAPARELAFQIYNQAKKFTKALGLRVACIYGGAGVADQIADLKRGSEIVVCTPGRMIDILCMQAGKLVSLKRVTMVVMDEADRMFDMGFEPQIQMILQNVRPDRQTVLFSATFPKQIEKLAKSVLRLPLEIVVGERSTVNKDITQIVEVREEVDKFLRLLQLLGVWYERGSVLIFVDKQEKCDQLFQDLLKAGYPCLSLHGGKEQVDRDHTLHEFKTGVKTVMVATSVAGRGLDVPEIVLVVNYNCPNHLEEYVHRVGRTGRAGRKGTAVTFVTQRDEQYAPLMVKVLQKAGNTVPEDLAQLAAEFRAKVEKGEAKWADYNMQKAGKGFKFDASEMNETQKIASMQRKAYDAEQGAAAADTAGNDADDEDEDDIAMAGAGSSSGSSSRQAADAAGETIATVPVITANMTPLEKARALAASIGLKPWTAAATGSSSSSIGSGGTVNQKAALEKARQIAQQMASSSSSKGGAASSSAGAAAGTAEDYFSDEIDINDYPHQARRKVTNRNAIEEIVDRTGVAIISRGVFIPAGKKPEAGERRLHLLIEGNSLLSVKQARLEIQRLLDEETIRISMSGNLATTGRYSVL